MMKRIIYLLLILVLPVVSFAQRSSNATHRNVQVDKKSRLIGNVTVGSSSFDASAVLTITSTTQGALMPRMNTTARDNISTPTDGLLIFNTSTNQYEFFETTWQAVGGGADGNGIYDGNGSLSINPTIVTMGGNSLIFSGNQTTFKGLDATSGNDALLVEDNVGTDLLLIQNDGLIGINNGTPIRQLHIVTSGGQTQGAGFRFGDASSNQHVEIGANGSTSIGTPNISSLNNIDGQGFLLTSRIPIANDVETFGINAGLMFNAERVGGGLLAKSRIMTISNGLQPRFVMATGDFNSSSHSAFYDDKSTFVGDDPNHVLELWALETNAFQVRVYDVTVTGVSDDSPKITMRGSFDSDVTAGVTATDFDGDIQIVMTDTVPTGRMAFSVDGTEGLSIDENGDVTVTNIIVEPTVLLTLGAAVTTFVATGNKMKLTGDGGANSVTTITGGRDGMTLTLTFVDALITLTDDNSSTANTINLPASFVSTANDVVVLEFDGTSWRQATSSVN